MSQDAHLNLQLPSISGYSTPPPDHAQAHRRLFLGPIPYNVSSTDNQENAATDFVSQHGLRIFLQQGGHIDEWTEAKAKEYKERLKQRILESAAWHAVSNKKRKKKGMMSTVEWRGDTFEIGRVTGVNVNMLATTEETIPAMQGLRRSSDRSVSGSKSAATVHWDDTSRTSRTTFVTARSSLSGVTSSSDAGSPQLEPYQSASLPHILSDGFDSQGEGTDLLESTSSTTHLVSDISTRSTPHLDSTRAPRLRVAKSENDVPKATREGLKSILIGSAKDKGKGRAVRYAEASANGNFSESHAPAPPHEVLGRLPNEVEDSSAAAAAEAAQANVRFADGGESSPVVERDRMLVRVFRCEHEGLKSPFVDQDCRATRGLISKEWDEFLIIWRNRRLELYEDYHTPCKERFLGHKHLAFVIPLASTRTKLSLFSVIDMSFCLICPPTPTNSKEGRGRRSIFHRSPRGLNVFVFKHKSRSRALDWIWQLWMELGGAPPDHIEIACPLVHARVSMPIPDAGSGWHMLSRDYVIDQCSAALERSFAWQTVIQLPILNGRRLELCWRSGAKLDWVWLKDDVDGQRRDWEVLFGAAVNKLGSPSQLELHLASHYPTRVTVGNGNYLDEPPSIEGYVHSYKRNSPGVQVQHYLSTHDGYLFSVQVERVAAPPTPTDLGSFAKSEDKFREDEKSRLRGQILNASWFLDLRSILLVRRAIHVAHQAWDARIAGQQTPQPNGPLPDVVEPLQEFQGQDAEPHRTNSDIDDEGGEAALTSVVDKGRLKMQRSFELVLKNGRNLRFEVHSTKVAIEWVVHLRALIRYWANRNRQDTVNEMIIQESIGGDRITAGRRYKNGFRHPVYGTVAENAALNLDDFWNWCVLDGCRQILKSGEVYMKQKLRAQYQRVNLILIRGCLIQFVVRRTRSHPVGRINLIDTYVCSGYYAALALTTGEYDPNAPPVARYFSDGLETKDVTEDNLFLLWYRPHPENAKGDNSRTPIPRINSKRRIVTFRARSKLERDAWCWALNSEIERLVRETKDREYRIRGLGNPA